MKRWVIPFVMLVLIIAGIDIFVYYTEPEYAYDPPKDNIVNEHIGRKGYDIWGEYNSKQEAGKTLKTSDGNQKLSSQNGTVKIDDELLEIGRETFYKETFGNEVFLTDIMGIVNGAFVITEVIESIMELGGEGTTNLRVELAKDVTIGGKSFEEGTKVDTGIDVAKGTYAPLGMPVKASREGMRIGITCAACHATVDRTTKKVIEGAPNTDLNTGLLMALATNSTAYFTHAEISSVHDYVGEIDETVAKTNGEEAPLPDPEAIEKAVDRTLLKWPPGNFDSTIDMVGNPAQIPDSFTLGDHPYGWSGFAMAGPFNGLSVFSNNVHAQNADSLAQSEISKALFNIDKEVYLGTILRNAANEKFRYDSNQDSKKPSEFFASVDPTPGVPGVNELIKPPTFPKVSLMAPDGLIASSPEYHVNEQNNGVSAWQNTTLPAEPKIDVSPETIKQGRRVFDKAGCISCHAGKYLTNNRIISAEKIGTEPSRAKALKKLENVFSKPLLYPPHTAVPIPKDADILKVPTDLNNSQIKLGFAFDNSGGGYKVPSLIGLYWTAPYLHDGGVAVGKNPETQLGMTGTLLKGFPADPRNSLRALVDQSLRQKVIHANQESRQLQSVHVKGIGHEFWVDESTGFAKEQQDALISYLLSLNEIE